MENCKEIYLFNAGKSIEQEQEESILNWEGKRGHVTACTTVTQSGKRLAHTEIVHGPRGTIKEMGQRGKPQGIWDEQIGVILSPSLDRRAQGLLSALRTIMLSLMQHLIDLVNHPNILLGLLLVLCALSCRVSWPWFKTALKCCLTLSMCLSLTDSSGI